MAGLQEFCRAVARIFSLCVRFIIWRQPQIDIDRGLAFIILWVMILRGAGFAGGRFAVA